MGIFNITIIKINGTNTEKNKIIKFMEKNGIDYKILDDIKGNF
jgi:hypothetical protein